MMRGCVCDSSDKIKPPLCIILMASEQITTVQSFHHPAPLTSPAGACVCVCALAESTHYAFCLCPVITAFTSDAVKIMKNTKRNTNIPNLAASFGLLVDFLVSELLLHGKHALVTLLSLLSCVFTQTFLPSEGRLALARLQQL